MTTFEYATDDVKSIAPAVVPKSKGRLFVDFITSTDHKKIGRMFMGVSLALALAVAVLYALALTVFVYRSIKWEHFVKAASKAVRTTGVILLLIGWGFAHKAQARGLVRRVLRR